MRFILLFLLLTATLSAEIINIGPGRQYTNLEQAAAVAEPGDSLLLDGGTYQGGLYISDLQGSEDALITIMPYNDEVVVFSGGSQAFHLVNPAYLLIKGLVFEQQTTNGVNIDDGGDYSTPATNITIENCYWHDMNATGNNDFLKLSGLDNFTVRNCSFVRGSAEGSMIDMVGCHYGLFEMIEFTDAGSNCIQAKGGTEYITIRRNIFRNGGERSINIGGHTGAQFFRPIDAPFESSHIFVHSNIFIGAVTAFAFVGTVESAVINNTIILPEKWAFRILQENNDGMEQCGYNQVANNIFYLSNASVSPIVNVGENTQPETFDISNNLWFNSDNHEWTNVSLPKEETNGIAGQAPGFTGTEDEYRIDETSPAFMAGIPIQWLGLDFAGDEFRNPPSIGAYEVSSVGVKDSKNYLTELSAYPSPATNELYIKFSGKFCPIDFITISDIRGRLMETLPGYNAAPDNILRVNLTGLGLASGIYYISISSEGRNAGCYFLKK